MSLFIKIPKSEGSATADQYQGWSPIHSMEMSAKNTVSTRTGSATDRNLNHPQFSDVTIYKNLDGAMITALQNLCNGEVMDKLELHVCHNDKGLSPYLKYTFYNAMIAEHAHAVLGDGADLEEIVLHYTKFETTYIKRDGSNKAGSPKTMGYDIEKAKVL